METKSRYGAGSYGGESITDAFKSVGEDKFMTAPTTVRQRYEAQPATPSPKASKAGMAGDILAGSVTGGMMGGPWGAVAGGAVGLTKALFTYYGSKKQEAENKRVENMNIAMYEKDEAKRAKADAWMKEYQAKKDAEARELMKFNKVQGFMDNLSSLMREKPKLQANLVNSWNSRSR